MVFAAHPPSYLPGLAFFYKLYFSDVLVIADDLQFTKHSEINRSVIKTAKGKMWLTVPVLTRGRAGQPIRQVEVARDQNWRARHRKSLSVNYRHAAYFGKYAEFFEDLYARPRRSLLDLNLEIIQYLTHCFGITTRLHLLSELRIPGKGRDRILRLAQTLGADNYLVGRDLSAYLDSNHFEENQVKLSFVPETFGNYHQLFGEFVSDLSAVDLLFNEGDEGLDLVFAGRKPE